MLGLFQTSVGHVEFPKNLKYICWEFFGGPCWAYVKSLMVPCWLGSGLGGPFADFFYPMAVCLFVGGCLGAHDLGLCRACYSAMFGICGNNGGHNEVLMWALALRPSFGGCCWVHVGLMLGLNGVILSILGLSWADRGLVLGCH